MASDHHFSGSSQYVASQIMNTREAIARSQQLLGKCSPDSFAGRKTQEPFPTQDDPIERADLQKLINSELQPPE